MLLIRDRPRVLNILFNNNGKVCFALFWLVPAYCHFSISYDKTRNFSPHCLSQTKCIHSIEKMLSCENYKPLTMRPNRFMGRCVLSFAYSKNKMFRLVADVCCMWQSKWCKPTECFTVLKSYGDENFGTF